MIAGMGKAQGPGPGSRVDNPPDVEVAGDLPRPLQQILFDTADGATPPAPASLSRAG
jgi:hypothetical protein